MRSSVSYMLSHGSGEPTMSHPDYEQHAHHHASLLVLIRGIGNSKPRSLQRIFERIQNTNNIKITDSSGTNRNIWVRYVQDHPIENNEWGDFQTHRRLLGLITVGKFDSQLELNELCRIHESLKVKYTNTLYDSRCILFGSTNGSGNRDDNDDNDNVTIRDTLITGNEDFDNLKTVNSENATELEIQKQSLETQTLDSSFTTPANFKSRAFFYPENDECASLESNIEEFINALFWIIESKRLEKSRERIDKVALLLAPFEKKDMIGLDMDSRSNRKRCMGRITKHLGDLTLQSGLISESLTLFHAANETLGAINDSLWIGAANEGLCAASSILLYPHIRTNNNNTPINNLTNCNNTNENNNHNNNNNNNNNCNNTPTVVDLRNGKIRIEKNEMVSIKPDKLKSSNKIENQNEISPCSSTAPTSSSSSSTSSVSSILSNTSAASSSTSSSSSSTGSGSSSAISSTLTGSGTAEGINTLSIPPNCLQPDDITTKYKEAIINYSKYRPAGIIETEALLKAARICIEQNQKLNVAMFLQNILSINLNVSDFERVQRFETLIKLYERIGYHRKAAFCYRLAAWRHIDQTNTNPDWSESYRLMLDSFPGHKLTLNPIDVVRNNAGWPCLQIDLLQQLMVAAKRLGHSALATRHMTFLLQTMWKHLTPTEQRDCALQLQNLSAQCEGSPVPLVLENGKIIPPSNLTDIPYCESIQIKDLPSHLKPHKILIHKVDDGPFIFTPIHLSSSIDRRTNKKKESKIAFQWVQHDLCEVTVKLKNVLPFELKVSDIRLLTNGIVFESVPQTVVLPTGSTNSTLVTLHGTPIECGLLEIEGYSTHALGIKSNCRLDNMLFDDRSFPVNYQIDVISALPKIKIETSLPQTATFSGLTMADSVITSASLTLFNGECFECTMTIINTSSIAIEFLECTLHSNLDEQLQNRIFSWVNSDIENQLPIKSNSSIEIKIKIFGDADFFGSGGGGGGNQITTAGAMSSSTISTHNIIGGGGSEGPSSLSGTTGGGGGGIMNTLSVLKHKSLPSRMNSPNSTPRRNDVLTSSFRSTRSGGHSSVATLSLGAGNVPRQIEAQMRIRYSGGMGLKEGFCRQCAVSFCLELLPSAQIINWDILPAEMPSQFYLVLDVANLTAQDMSLKYTTNKTILIEAKETCRFPVPVERCPLEKLYDAMTNSNNENNDNPNSVYSIPLTEADLLERACSEHITNQVNLQWSLNGTETNGVASLKGLQLSSTMLGLITVAPLHWEITIDNTPILPQTEVKCCTGQMILFGVLIRNLSPTALQQLTLTVQFYQDYQNGVHNYRLETRVTTSGPSQIAIDSLNHNDHIYHEFSAIFFAPGIYKTDLQCCSMAFNKSIGNPHGITTHLGSATGAGAGAGAGGGAGGGGGGETQIWRYIPPIEITVNE